LRSGDVTLRAMRYLAPMPRWRLKLVFTLSVAVVVLSLVATALAAFSPYTRWWQYCLYAVGVAGMGHHAWRVARALWPAHL
jgi:hypothetical protein